MAAIHPLILVLFFLFPNALKSSKVIVDLEFIVPGSSTRISSKLSVASPKGVTFSQNLRSILFINKLVMDCTFNFDPNIFNKNKPLICDVNTACISSYDSQNEILHFENLGIGDLQITEITKQNKILFYDEICIGDSKQCNGRYIDFKLFTKAAAIVSQMHPKNTVCNRKNKIYQTTETVTETNNNDAGNGSKRKLLASQFYDDEVYGDINYHKKIRVITHAHTGHSEYMDIILTVIFLVLIVFSVFNMSYAFSHIKSNKTSRRQYVDTRRV